MVHFIFFSFSRNSKMLLFYFFSISIVFLVFRFNNVLTCRGCRSPTSFRLAVKYWAGWRWGSASFLTIHNLTFGLCGWLSERSSISYLVKDKDFCSRRFCHHSCPCLCFRSRSGVGVHNALCHWSYFVQDIGPHLTGTKVSTCRKNRSLIIHNFPLFKNIPHFLIPCPFFYLPTFCNSPFNHPEFRPPSPSVFTTFLFLFRLLLGLLSMFNSSLFSPSGSSF